MWGPLHSTTPEVAGLGPTVPRRINSEAWVDAFSKFVWLIPLREATTRATMYALREKIFSTFSVPAVIVSDNARCFTSREFRRFCFNLGVKHVTTSPYYPQPSHAERFNRNLRAALIAYHSHDHTIWDSQLHWLQLAFNSSLLLFICLLI